MRTNISLALVLILFLTGSKPIKLHTLSDCLQQINSFYKDKLLVESIEDYYEIKNTRIASSYPSVFFYYPRNEVAGKKTSFSKVIEKKKSGLHILSDTLSKDIVYGTLWSSDSSDRPWVFFFSKKTNLWIIFHALPGAIENTEVAEGIFNFHIDNIKMLRVFDSEGNFLSMWIRENNVATIDDIKQNRRVAPRVLIGHLLKKEANTMYNYPFIAKQLFSHSDMDMDINELFSMIQQHHSQDLSTIDSASWDKRFSLKSLCGFSVIRRFSRWCD